MVSKSHQMAFNLGANTGYGSKISHQQNSLTWILKSNCACCYCFERGHVLLFETLLVQVNYYQYFESP